MYTKLGLRFLLDSVPNSCFSNEKVLSVTSNTITYYVTRVGYALGIVIHLEFDPNPN